MHDRRIADIEKALIAGEDGREKKCLDLHSWEIGGMDVMKMMFSKKVILFDYGYFGVSILILKFQACVFVFFMIV